MRRASQTAFWNGEPPRASGVLKVIERPAKYGRKLRFDLRDRRRPARGDTGLVPVPQPLDLALESAPVDEFEQVERALVGDRGHRSQRRIDPSGEQRARRAVRGRRAHDPRKCVAKAAWAIEACVELGVDDSLAGADRLECGAEPSGARVLDEGHPEAFRNWRRAVEACTASASKSASRQRFKGSRSTAATSRRTTSEVSLGCDSGRQRAHGR